MNSELVSFVFDGHQVRTVRIDGEPWVNVADVCDILELQNGDVSPEHWILKVYAKCPLWPLMENSDGSISPMNLAFTN